MKSLHPVLKWLLAIIGIAIVKTLIIDVNKPKQKSYLDYMPKHSETKPVNYDYPKDCYINISEIKSYSGINIVVCHPCDWRKVPSSDTNILGQFSNELYGDAMEGVTISIYKFKDRMSDDYLKRIISADEVIKKNKNKNYEIISSDTTKIGGLYATEIFAKAKIDNVGFSYYYTNSVIFKKHIITTTYLVSDSKENTAKGLFNLYKKYFQDNTAKLHFINL